jgi:hypothetical protein
VTSSRTSKKRRAIFQPLASTLLTAVAVVSMLAVAQSSHASVRPDDGYSGEIVNYYGVCLDDPNGTSQPVQPQIWQCNNNPQQVWLITPTDNGEGYVIVNDASLMCLSILNNASSPPAEVIQHSCNYSGSDQWEDWDVNPDTSGDQIIFNVGLARAYMHPSGNEIKNGEKIWATSSAIAPRAAFWRLPGA